MYLRDLDSFAKMLEQDQQDEKRKWRVLRAMAVCMVYGYLDYALEILDESKGLFGEVETRSLAASIRGNVTLASKLPDFRGRTRIFNTLNALAKFFQPSYKGWAVLGDEIGNVDYQ